MRVIGNIDMYVGKIECLSETVKCFSLYPSDRQLLPAFTGGAHITTYIKNGDKEIEREYSLVSHPTERTHYSIAINRDPNSRGGSVYWHDQVKVGDKVTVTFPKNHFPLSFQAKHHVFYAAGIGITPFLTMMADLEAEGKTFELHYAARTKESCAFYDYLQTNYPGKCTFYFSRSEEAVRMNPETMKSHRIGSHVYFCGPVSMVSEYKEAALAYGYPEGSVHFELFAAAQGDKNPFTAELSNSNLVLEVNAEQTLLEALLEAGVEAPYSCKAGGCGQCEVEVVEGEVDHLDIFYTDEERKERNIILTCCSRAKEEKLVLNL
ncbi:PDR/VanB family oxidoreductase [Bacillus sp. FJAT-52991]|uniref:PDR/VanB family oxidoreductase n=1 Tax=Bacillus kandeliae TaxID=3129297 RepID=A0ABZ2N5A7_9BACI